LFLDVIVTGLATEKAQPADTRLKALGSSAEALDGASRGQLGQTSSIRLDGERIDEPDCDDADVADALLIRSVTRYKHSRRQAFMS
jgi:hypothetical protein